MTAPPLPPLAPTEPRTVFAWCGARWHGTGIDALFALDRQLAQIVRATREVVVGQMRLTWWHAALTALDHAPAPPQPVLEALAATVLPRGVRGAALARLVEGWEELLDEGVALDRYAAARGGALFEAAGRLIAAADPRIALAGEGWALADLAANVADPALAAEARAAARTRFDAALARRWRNGRVVAALARDAALALGGVREPTRAAAVLRMRLFGR